MKIGMVDFIRGGNGVVDRYPHRRQRGRGVGKTCGGFFGQPCDAGLFCQFKPGTCGRFDLTGICAVKPRFCPQVTGPKLVVCGCDGKTFFNDCARRQAGVSLAHKGKCE